MLLLLVERMKVKEFITKKPFLIAGPCSAETEEQTIEIAKAIEFILTNPEKAKEMGQNGSRLVKEKYNWTNEELKLINIYKKLGC